MIPNYSAPGTTIQQILSTYQPASTHRLSPCIIGNVYELKRYTNASEKVGIVPTSFAFTQTSIVLEPSTGYTVQDEDAKLYIEDALFTIKSNLTIVSDATALEPNVVKITAGAIKISDVWYWGSANTDVPVVIGQQLAFGAGLPPKTILAIVPAIDATVAVTPKFAATNGTCAEITVDATDYTGTTDTTFTFTCTAKVANTSTTFLVRDSETGLSTTVTVLKATAGTATLRGIAITIDKKVASTDAGGTQTGYTANSTVVYATILKAARTDEDTLALLLDSAPAVNDLAGNNKSVLAPYTGELLKVTSYATNNWSKSGHTITVVAAPHIDYFANSLTIYNTGNTEPTIYPSYRAMRTTPVDTGLVTITSLLDILNGFGTYGDEDNPLAFGLAKAFIASAGGTVYGVEINGVSINDWSAPLVPLAASKLPYMLVPLTTDMDVLKLYASHVASMSTEEEKKWRRLYTVSQIPDEWRIHSTTFTVSGGALRTATATTAGSLPLTVRGGMTLRVYAGVEPTDYAITGATADAITVSTNMVAGTYAADVMAPNTPAFAKTYIQDRVSQLASVRVSHIWSDTTENLLFQACELAGTRSALPPHKGMTRMEVSYLTDLPRMYTKYTKQQLNDIAALGVMIITQDDKDGTPYVRHQLTTMTTNGAASQEESVINNFDQFCHDRADIIDKYIGQYNATNETLAMVDLELRDMLNKAAAKPQGDWLGLGARLEYKPEDIVVQRHPTFRDRFQTFGKISLPTPLNNMEEFWFGEQL